MRAYPREGGAHRQRVSTTFWLGKKPLTNFFLCSGRDSNLWSWKSRPTLYQLSYHLPLHTLWINTVVVQRNQNAEAKKYNHDSYVYVFTYLRLLLQPFCYRLNNVLFSFARRQCLSLWEAWRVYEPCRSESESRTYYCSAYCLSFTFLN